MSKICKRENIILLLMILFFGYIPFSVKAQNINDTVSSGDSAYNEENHNDDTDDNVLENSGADSETPDSSVSDGDAYIPEGVVSVLIPTEFDLFILYDSHNGVGYIQSQDIMVINKSDFPVNMKIKDVHYENSGEAENPGGGEIELSLRLRQYGQSDVVLPVLEEGVEAPLAIELEKGKQNTNAQELLQQAAKWSPTGPVGSADYAVLRLDGTMGAGNWKDGSLKVQITYEFERAESDLGFN